MVRIVSRFLVGTTLACALGVGLLATAARAEVVNALPGGTWSVLPETTAGGSVTIVHGPGVPPAGIGSLRLTVASVDDRALVGSDLGTLESRPWGGLSASYFTYVGAGDSPSFVPTLRFAGFQIVTPVPQNFTTLSFEPGRNGSVIGGQWQEWTLGPTSIVWQTNTSDGFCVMATPCTLAEFTQRYPDGAWGQAQIGLGSGVAGPASGYADAVTINDRSTVLYTDFDPTPLSVGAPPTLPSDTPDATLPVTGEPDTGRLLALGAVLACLGAALMLAFKRSPPLRRRHRC